MNGAGSVWLDLWMPLENELVLSGDFSRTGYKQYPNYHQRGTTPQLAGLRIVALAHTG